MTRKPRISFKRPSGPGLLPFDYFEDDPAKSDWKPVPPAAKAAFPDATAIMSQGIVSAG